MISWVAMDRIVERNLAADSDYRLSPGKALRSSAKPLTDDELLAKLGTFGIHLDRSKLEQLCQEALSAEEIAKPLLDRQHFRNNEQELEGEWIWVCLSALWERWFPHLPCFELLDDKMQTGYELDAARDETGACRVWLEAWHDVLSILDKAGMKSIREFDSRFRGTQSLFNWIQDLQDGLWNAGLDDQQFLTARVASCEEGLKRFPTDDELTTENRRRALASSYNELGEAAAKVDALYRDWLAQDPRWGWGWIGWSDCFRITRTERVDMARSDELLREGLAVPDLRDRADVLERLAHSCEDQGKAEEAKDLWQQVRRAAAAEMESSRSIEASGTVLRQATKMKFGGEGLPLSELSNLASLLRNTKPAAAAQLPIASKTKVGRNEPCPCGSGKKFKKCCGA